MNGNGHGGNGTKPKAQRALLEREERYCVKLIELGHRAQAARAAGYKGDDDVLKAQAYELHKRPEIRARLEQLREAFVMQAKEVLVGLSEMASKETNSIEHFVSDSFELDLGTARKLGVLHLAESVTETTRTDKTGAVTVTRTVRLYSRLAAYKTLAKHHALLTDLIAVRDLPKDERGLEDFIEREAIRTMGPEKARAIMAVVRGNVAPEGEAIH